MFFAKNERKKRHPIMKMLVGAFAALGACTVVSAGKNLVKNAGEKMSGLMKKMCRKKKSDETADNAEN